MRKKLIEFGWDVPSPAYLARNIRRMEERPFDGVMIKMGGPASLGSEEGAEAGIVEAVTVGGVNDYSQVFRAREVDERAYRADLDALSRIEWDRFTDNFAMMFAASDMDWFSEEDWGPDGWVLRNVGMCARVARAGRCKGLTFDAEPYWREGPWKYEAQPWAGEKSYAEYEEIVRKRGAQFMARIQDEFSEPVIHTFFLNSLFPHVAKEPDPAKRSEMLKGEFYGLVAAFLNGMLDAAAPGTIITDGNEESYYYTSAQSFLESYHVMRQTALELIAPELRDKYRCQVQASQALYVDQLFSLRADRLPGAFMSAEEQARLAEHNVYWGLTCCDGYMWLYSENMNWWTGERVPPMLEEAVRSGRRKAAAGEPLGFEVAEFTARAERDLKIAMGAPIRPRTAGVRRLGPDEAPPAIDGRIEEDVWMRREGLGFVPFLIATQKFTHAKTRAWLAYDERNLYVAIRCEEPNMSGLVPVGRDEENIGNTGDRVDIVLAPFLRRREYRRIAIDPRNGRWDGLAGKGDSSWSPEYESAAHCGEDFWSVEAAIPWRSLDMTPPRPGDKMAANLFRLRGRWNEYSSWSQSRLNRGPEPENFGTWVFE